MKNLQNVFIAIFLILFLFGTSEAQTKTCPSFYFSTAKGSGKNQAYFEFDKWRFSIGKDKYEIRKNGEVKRIGRKGFTQNFSYKLEDAQSIRQVYFACYINDLILLFETIDGRNDRGVIIRFDNRLQPKWESVIPDWNIGKGLIEEKNAYLTARRFIGKLSLEDGKYIWKIEKDFGFHGFEAPRLKDNSVFFREDVNSGTHTVEINKISGEIIKITSL